MSRPSEQALRALTEQKRLLQAEYDHERRAFSEIRERMGIVRLAARGDAWPEVELGRSYFNSLNRRVVEVRRRGGDEDADDHHFEYGKAVCFFCEGNPGRDGSRIGMLVPGTVNFVDGGRMVVAVADNAPLDILQEKENVGIMLAFDETTYRVMNEAVDRLMRADGRLGQLRDLFYSDRCAEMLTVSPMNIPYLNESQQEAVNLVLRSKDVAIVHGPPGTGKTTTLVEAIAETLRRESQVMVCAQSNMAVDWICELLTDRGIHVLRIGNPSRVNDKMLGHTYERRFEAHPSYPALWAVRKAIRELQGVRRRSTEQWHQKMDRLKDRAAALEIEINNDLFNSAHVVASTLIGSASPVLVGKKFSTLFIDEAAQAMEAASWVAIQKAGRVVLAGDHCQLPPTVKSYEAMKGGLGRSLMERLAENHPEAVALLTVQYRMNVEIMQFSSSWFYEGKMIAAPEVKYRNILDFDSPIVWIDTSQYAGALNFADEDGTNESFRETLAGESFGRINRDEAALTLLTLQKFITRVGKERFLAERMDVGLISPYRAQTRYLRRMLRRLSFFKPFLKAITVDTVDGFQGRERDIIIVSLVRSNEHGDIGFLKDLRRMNVAMTRARMKLIIIGDAPTLTRHAFYRQLYRSIGGGE